MCLVMMFCSWLSYVDRQILAVLSPMILAETAMTTQTYSTVVSAFSIAYMIGNPFWGSMLDRLGLRAGMMIAVGIWSVASASHAMMGGFAGFAAARAVLGFGEGATFPGGLRAAVESLPPYRQSRGIAISYSGGSLGAILTPLVVVPVALAFGWKTAFLLTGVLGILWLAIWFVVARPPFLPVNAKRSVRVVLPNIKERRFWALVASYGLGASAIGPLLYLAPLYLSRVQGLSQADLGKVLWIPPLGWEIGYFFWGWAADRYTPDGSRPALLFVLLALGTIPLALVPHMDSTPLVLALFFWTMFVSSGFIVISLRNGAYRYPKEQTALVAGIGAGAWSALVAVLLPFLGKWFDLQRYADTFLLVSVLPTLGVVLWFLLREPRSGGDSAPLAGGLSSS